MNRCDQNKIRTAAPIVVAIALTVSLSLECLGQASKSKLDPRKIAARTTILCYEAQQELSRRNYESACRKFDEALKIQSGSRELKQQYANCLDKYALDLFKSKDYKKAIEKVGQALKLAPGQKEYEGHLSRFKCLATSKKK